MKPYTEIILLKRRHDITREAFLAHYRDIHGPLMVRLLGDKGLLSYEHFPIEETLSGTLETNGTQFDAVSIYTFESQAAAELRHGMEEATRDSAVCMEISSLVIFNTHRRRVFPVD